MNIIIKENHFIYKSNEHIVNDAESNNTNKSKEKIKINELLETKDYELNSLDYEEALKLDHRTFYEYYITSLKCNHPIMFSFNPENDYNSKIIRLFLFFFAFTLDLTINTLFFNDNTMHKIYEDHGKYNFLFQIPSILYSTLISKILDSIVKIFALSQDNIIDLKKKEIENKESLDKNYNKVIRILQIKYIIFFVISFIILMFCWYYLICFCGIYVHTQKHLIKSSLIGFVTSLVYPFIFYLIIGMFRIASLRKEKPSGSYLYKFSTFLEDYIG